MKNATIALRRLSCLLPVIGLLFAASCTMRETTREGVAFQEPRVQLRAVEAASLGTLDVLPLKVPADVDLPRRNQLIAGYVNKNLPLKATLRLNVFNPNLESTAVTALDYTVLVDGKELGSGREAVSLELPAQDSMSLPLTIDMNTYKLLGNDALPALRNFALGFGDVHRERLTVRIRPITRNSRGRLSVLIHRKPVIMASGLTKHTAQPN